MNARGDEPKRLCYIYGMEQQSFTSPAPATPVMQTAPAAPTQKKSNTGLIVALVITILALIGVSVALIIVLAARKEPPTKEISKEECVEKLLGDIDIPSMPDLPKPSTNDKSEDDVQREDDISRFLTAANDFQANNNGKTPWDSGTTNEKWVRRYIDNKCTADTPEQADDSCGNEFRDPDGQPYYFVYEGNLAYAKKASVQRDHGIRVYTYAQCDDGDDGSLTVASGKRQFAMLYKLSDGSITCNDNH